MRVLIIAPGIYPVTSDRYGGIERLVHNLAYGLAWTHEDVLVDVLAPEGTKLPPEPNIRHVSSGPAIYDFHEPNLLGSCFLYRLDGVTPDCVLDFSHSRPAQHFSDWKTVTPIWHDPYVMQPALPRTNIAALSNWQAQRHYTKTGVWPRVRDPITASWQTLTGQAQAYYVNWQETSGRFICVGKLHPTKGALLAAELCREIGQELDIVGPVTKGDPPEYVERVRALCDGRQIVYHGELPNDALQDMLLKASALLYPVHYQTGFGEAHSHKAVDAMALGCPVLVIDQGAMREVVKDGETGFVGEDMKKMVLNVHNIDRYMTSAYAFGRWGIPTVGENWYRTILDVKEGAQWS